MAEPFLAEIRIMSFNFAPKGWATCDGQILPINQNQALFSLLGTAYGGNGQINFALPNLQGRVPVHVGSGIVQGQSAGESAHTLTASELPAHTHSMRAKAARADAAGGSIPDNTKSLAQGVAGSSVSDVNLYSTAGPYVGMAASAVMPTGGGLAHENMQPYLALTFCIALQGIFPSRN